MKRIGIPLQMAFRVGILLVAAWPRTLLAYDEIVVNDGATIRGVVKVEGKVPQLAPPQITKYREVCKDVPNEALVSGPANGLRYAVVTIEGISKGKAVEREISHELDNVGCRFVPHVQAASVGQFIALKNSDPILHAAHATFAGDQPQFNIALFPAKVSRKPLISAGLLKIKCEIHPWMSAYVVVTDHPYQAVTDAYGEYQIDDIPAGDYRVKVWHELLDTKEKPVTLKAGETASLDFVLAPKVEVMK